MDLGNGSNTDGTGIGDSKYATDAQPRSTVPTVSPCASPSFSSLPALHLTIEYQSPSQVDVNLMQGLNEILDGNTVPLSSSSDDALSDSGLNTLMVDRMPAHRLVAGKVSYDSMEEVASDVRRLGD